MSSIKSNDVVLNNDKGYWDISIEDGDIKTDNAFDTAIIVSLQTDARADSSEIPDAYRRRGWIGNEFSDTEMGSKIWLYSQARRTRSNLNGLQTTTENALQWLIDLGAVLNNNIAVSYDGNTGANVFISTIASGNKTSKYYPLWIDTGDS